MILSGLEIAERMGKDIHIDPYHKDQLNPNSYNLRLHDELLVYDRAVLDMKADNEVRIKTIIAYRHNVSDTLAEPHTFNLALLKKIAVGISMR